MSTDQNGLYKPNQPDGALGSPATAAIVQLTDTALIQAKSEEIRASLARMAISARSALWWESMVAASIVAVYVARVTFFPRDAASGGPIHRTMGWRPVATWRRLR